MEKNEFKILIDAPPEKVWNVLWNDASYPQWTSAFAEGSKVETDWKEGSKVLFLDGKGQGMISIIAKKKPNEFMSFKHIGTVNNGVEDLDSPQTKEWAGALENYTLKKYWWQNRIGCGYGHDRRIQRLFYQDLAHGFG